MVETIDTYLSALLAFVPKTVDGRHPKGDYLSLIHIPAQGAEQVYSLTHEGEEPLLCVARFRETVWSYVESSREEEGFRPSVDVLRANIPTGHPVFSFITSDLLDRCESHGDGEAGLDYYMLIYSKGGESRTVECWEPYGNKAHEWMTLIGAMQTLSSQFEYAINADEAMAGA